MLITPLNRSDMEENHARARAAVKKNTTQPLSTKPHNVEIVLDMGNVVFFHFRGRAYGMPPLPWAEGQKILSVWLDAKQYPSPLTPETQAQYFAALSKLPRLLWRNCFPANRFRRFLRALGLLKNPFHIASDQELAEYANFFLERRMRFGASFPRPMLARHPNVEMT